MASDLERLKEANLYARDMLDDAAQVYVKAINQLDELVQDIGKNEKQIWDTVKNLKEASTKSTPVVLNSAQEAQDTIQAWIDSL